MTTHEPTMKIWDGKPRGKTGWGKGEPRERERVRQGGVCQGEAKRKKKSETREGNQREWRDVS